MWNDEPTLFETILETFSFVFWVIIVPIGLLLASLACISTLLQL